MSKPYLPPNVLKLQESVFAVEEDGTRLALFRRSWKERLFTRPWRPWVGTKIIQVPNYKPVIFCIGNTIVYHPALKEDLMKWLSHE